MNVQHLQNNPYNTSTGCGYTWPHAPSNLSLSGSVSQTISRNNSHFPSQIQHRNCPPTRTTCSRHPINNQNFGKPMYQNTHGVHSCNCSGQQCPPQPVNCYPFFNPYQYQQWNCSSPPQSCSYSVQKASSQNKVALSAAEPNVNPYVIPISEKKHRAKVGHSKRENMTATGFNTQPNSRYKTPKSTSSSDYTYVTTETYKYTDKSKSSKTGPTGKGTATKTTQKSPSEGNNNDDTSTDDDTSTSSVDHPDSHSSSPSGSHSSSDSGSSDTSNTEPASSKSRTSSGKTKSTSETDNEGKKPTKEKDNEGKKPTKEKDNESKKPTKEKSSERKKPTKEKSSERKKPTKEKSSERKKPTKGKGSERKKPTKEKVHEKTTTTPTAEKVSERKKSTEEKDGELKKSTPAKDSKSHEGLGFCFNPDSAMATEFSITIDPEEPDPLEYALNNGIIPIICGYMPPSAAPCLPSFPQNNSKESPTYVPSKSSKTSSWYGNGSGSVISSYTSYNNINPYQNASIQSSQQSEQNETNNNKI
ncbi:unnamed protein product [Allacma fusca]|uniref:Uncharacterized protein n=1 Tax=Allacma fusca TaxID=39272 RepID=A0A8J2JTM3_9HEXA|nr:unnamed protein product [Allacma fusca]